MKILLVGEFSGFFKNLKLGFQCLNHEVTLLANSDGWKKIDGADILISSNLPGIFSKLSQRLQYLYHSIVLPKYDVILIVNPNIGLSLISSIFTFFLRKKSSKIFLSACGTDIEYITYGLSKKFDYWPYDNCKETLYRSKTVHSNVMNIVDYVIPTFYDYAEPWRNSKYKDIVLKSIPLCIDTDSIKTFYPISENKKIVFFHGLNRECFKGTAYIKEALLKMQKKYSSEMEVIIDGKMPLNEYLALMQRVDIVVDQCKAYSYGSMNSLYAMSMGKIVMGGFRKECKDEYNISDIPSGIIHIEPNVEQISKKIENLILNRKSLRKWGKENRKFVESNHDIKIIANKYLNLIESIN